MALFRTISDSPERTQEIGTILGKLARADDLFLLNGTLGSGKTCLTQGIAGGLNINEYLVSPTFVLVREYYGRISLFHIDLYRLDRIEDMLNIGLDDYLYGSGVCVIEWAEKGAKILPANNLSISFAHISQNKRELVIEAHGERYEQLVQALIEAL